MSLDLNFDHLPPVPADLSRPIGIIGAGFIVREVHLAAYRNAGFNVAAIASRTPEIAHEVADLHGIARVYDTPAELMADPGIEILDIAVPPDQQPALIEQAVEHSNIRGILAHKPLALNLADARRIVDLCARRRVTLAVNQNMRFDQSMRALHSLLRRGWLGEPVMASIEMRAKPHWQSWLRQYERLTLLNVSVHHLDCFRFLFGEPEAVFASVRRDPRNTFPHRDGIAAYVLEYAGGLRACGLDDTWGGPGDSPDALDSYIHWRVEGAEGVAKGSLGWPAYPNRSRSTIHFSTLRQPNVTFSPTWKQVWFPDAFEGTMGALMRALDAGVEPEISGRDNLRTMALVEACYRSVDERRAVRLEEVGIGGS